MDVLHGIAVLLLSVFSYSAGHAAAAVAERPCPHPADVAAAPAVAAVLLVASLRTPKAAALLVATFGGFLAGLVLRRGLDILAPSGPPDADQRARGASEPAWRRYLLRVGDFQGRLFLSLLYFSLIPPFVLVARLGRDALQMRAAAEDRSTYWHGTGAPEDVDDLRRPY